MTACLAVTGPLAMGCGEGGRGRAKRGRRRAVTGGHACTVQVERRVRQGPQRMVKLWRKDVREGYRVMEQWQARAASAPACLSCSARTAARAAAALGGASSQGAAVLGGGAGRQGLPPPQHTA